MRVAHVAGKHCQSEFLFSSLHLLRAVGTLSATVVVAARALSWQLSRSSDDQGGDDNLKPEFGGRRGGGKDQGMDKPVPKR